MRISVRERLSEAEAAGVLRLAGAAAGADHVAPLSERALLHLRYAGTAGSRDLLLTSGAELAGYAYLDRGDPAEGRSAELLVHPAHRGHGLGLSLTRALVSEAAPDQVRVWAHGDLPAAGRLAAAAGFTRIRALWQMSRPLADPAGDAKFPPGVTLRSFVPGRDEEAWLALNARAFAGHPEQGSWTMEDLIQRENEPWFDPDGFFLAERGGQLLGFHWTKIHPGMGEVYVIGVDPAGQGGGLGRALVLAGLRYLRSRGMGEVMLYVDETNTPAIRLYESMGFTQRAVDAMYGQG